MNNLIAYSMLRKLTSAQRSSFNDHVGRLTTPPTYEQVHSFVETEYSKSLREEMEQSECFSSKPKRKTENVKTMASTSEALESSRPRRLLCMQPGAQDLGMSNVSWVRKP